MAKVMLLASYAPSLLHFRGIFMETLSQHGHEVIACAPNICSEISKNLSQINVVGHSLPMQRTGLNPFKDLNTLLALRKIFIKERPDVLFSYTIKPVIFGSIVAHYSKVPKNYALITGLGYVFLGCSLKRRILRSLAKSLYKIALKRCELVFFQNLDDIELFIKLRIVKQKQTALINGSGVDLNYYQIKPLPKKPSFLLIARLIIEKGIQEYIEAAYIIRDRYPESVFTIVGWIDSSPAKINSSDLQKWQQDGVIKYKGEKKDVRNSIAEASVYVLPSYREGTPRTVLEAMAMGRPIITTDVPGCRETVENGKNGYLVPPRNPVALAQAMEKFILRPELCSIMGRESRKIVEKKYDVHQVNKMILNRIDLWSESSCIQERDHDKSVC